MPNASSNNQLAGERFLPAYGYHVRDSIVTFDDGRVMFTVRMNGVPFEAISDGMLRNQYDELNGLYLSQAKSAGGRLAAWLHLDHFETQFTASYDFEYAWMRDFSRRYMERFAGGGVFDNRFYMTFVLKRRSNDDLSDCIREMEEIQIAVLQSLRVYECEALKKYVHEENEFSEVYEFLAYLYNGFWERVPVTSEPAVQVLASSTLHHGYKLIETRLPDGGQHFDAYFDLKAFPDPHKRGMLNPLLELPFPFLLCLSFACVNSADAVRLMSQTLNKMSSAGDEAVDQQADIVIGKGAVTAGDIYFGELHGALRVTGSTQRQAEDRGATARTTLTGSCGTVFVPATASAPETLYSLFPGNIKRRPRKLPKTTRNLLGLFSMNTYSSGKQHGNPIGDGSAVMPLQTTVHGAYFFNFHYSLPDQDMVGQKVAGHTVILGATGVGKTTTQATLLSFLTRFAVQFFGVDKDGSMRGMVEANGGTYFRLASGEPTGLNPFQIDDDPFNRSFLYDLVGACGRKGLKLGDELTSEDTKDIKHAVDNVFELPFEQRRFGVLLQSIPDRGENCLARRLADWCYGDVDGRYAYALDNPTNAFDWRDFRRVAFDCSDFLVAGHPATEPILSYLFHLKTLMTRRGGLLATVIEEFWLPLSYPTTAAQMLDSLKTGRRRDEFMVMVTQSPEDAIKSPLLPDILQQTPTKIYLPNPDAEFKTLTGGGYSRFNMTEKEFKRLESLGTQSRKFIVKQGSQSSVVKLDLGGLGDYIAVLAMAQEDFKYLDAAKRQAGEHPDAWVPVYIDLRRRGRAKAPLVNQEREHEEEIDRA